MKTPNPDRTPAQEPLHPNDDPGQKNPRPPNTNNPSDLPRPGTDPTHPMA